MVHDKKGVKTFSNLMKVDNDVDDDDGDWKTFPKDFEGFSAIHCGWKINEFFSHSAA